MNTHNGRDGGRAVCYDQPFYKLRPTFDNHLSTLSLHYNKKIHKVHAMCNQTQFKLSCLHMRKCFKIISLEFFGQTRLNIP